MLLYCYSIISFSKGWDNNLKEESYIFHTTVSVVVAVRNEESNIINLLDDLSSQEFPQEFFEDFLKYVDLNQAEFWEIVDGFRSPHIWMKTGDNQKWALKHPII